MSSPTGSIFPQHASKIVNASEVYIANQKSWDPILQKYLVALKETCSQGSEDALHKHKDRGQLLARDRVALLLDEGSPFLEIAAFAGYENPQSTPAATLVTGIGTVCGIPTMILAHIPSLNGGAWNEFTVKKHNRITDIATKNGLPIIALVQSAGVFLPLQFHVFHYGGTIFRDLSRRSEKGKPSCAVVFGSSTAGGAYHPALSDYSIFVKDHARVFLGGPPLVKMATGETVDAEDLGGAKMHAMTTGLADQLAVDEFDAIRKAREWILTTTAARNVGIHSKPQVMPEVPFYDSEELLGIIDPDVRKPLDMMEVLLRIVDGSRLDIVKPLYGAGIITAWAHIHGHLAGIIANASPVINPEESDKATQFINLANQNRTPLIFLHNVSGFMVGLRTEQAGLIKKGARFVSAVSTSRVPAISIICGASYGAGNYAMCGRMFKPRFLFTWPTGRCSAMGPEQLSGVMETLMREREARKVRKGANSDEEAVMKEVKRLKDSVENDSGAYRLSSYLHDDGIIDPRDTRDVLGMCLEVVKKEPISASPGSQSLARL